MSLDAYVRHATRRERRRDRAAAAHVIRAELDALIAEAVAEGTPPAVAERQALDTHRHHQMPWYDPWHWNAFWTAPWQAASWRAVAFLFALFLLGLASFLWVTILGSLVLGLLILIIGVFLAGPFLLSLPYLGRAHGALAQWGTGQPMPLLHASIRTQGPVTERLRQRLTDPQIGYSFLSCIVTYVLGTVGLGWITGVGAISVYLLASPWIPTLPVFPGDGALYPDWVLAAAWRSIAFGLALLWPLTWGAQALAWLSGRAIRAVLTRT